MNEVNSTRVQTLKETLTTVTSSIMEIEGTINSLQKNLDLLIKKECDIVNELKFIMKNN